MKKVILKIMLIAFAVVSLTSCRDYDRTQDRLDKESEGKGDLLKAESTKKVKIEQAKADLESAKLDAQTKITEAQALSEISIIKANSDAKIKLTYAESRAKATLMQAEAEATANERLSKSITPLLIEYVKVYEWDGKLPTTTLGSSNSIINLK